MSKQYVARIHKLALVPRSFILARANSRKLPCSTPDVTSGIGMSLYILIYIHICASSIKSSTLYIMKSW